MRSDWKNSCIHMKNVSQNPKHDIQYRLWHLICEPVMANKLNIAQHWFSRRLIASHITSLVNIIHTFDLISPNNQQIWCHQRAVDFGELDSNSDHSSDRTNRCSMVGKPKRDEWSRVWGYRKNTTDKQSWRSVISEIWIKSDSIHEWRPRCGTQSRNDGKSRR